MNVQTNVVGSFTQVTFQPAAYETVLTKVTFEKVHGDHRLVRFEEKDGAVRAIRGRKVTEKWITHPGAHIEGEHTAIGFDHGALKHGRVRPEQIIETNVERKVAAWKAVPGVITGNNNPVFTAKEEKKAVYEWSDAVRVEAKVHNTLVGTAYNVYAQHRKAGMDVQSSLLMAEGQIKYLHTQRSKQVLADGLHQMFEVADAGPKRTEAFNKLWDELVENADAARRAWKVVVIKAVEAHKASGGDGMAPRIHDFDVSPVVVYEQQIYAHSEGARTAVGVKDSQRLREWIQTYYYTKPFEALLAQAGQSEVADELRSIWRGVDAATKEELIRRGLEVYIKNGVPQIAEDKLAWLETASGRVPVKAFQKAALEALNHPKGDGWRAVRWGETCLRSLFKMNQELTFERVVAQSLDQDLSELDARIEELDALAVNMRRVIPDAPAGFSLKKEITLDVWGNPKEVVTGFEPHDGSMPESQGAQDARALWRSLESWAKDEAIDNLTSPDFILKKVRETKNLVLADKASASDLEEWERKIDTFHIDGKPVKLKVSGVKAVAALELGGVESDWWAEQGVQWTALKLFRRAHWWRTLADMLKNAEHGASKARSMEGKVDYKTGKPYPLWDDLADQPVYTGSEPRVYELPNGEVLEQSGATNAEWEASLYEIRQLAAEHYMECALHVEEFVKNVAMTFECAIAYQSDLTPIFEWDKAVKLLKDKDMAKALEGDKASGKSLEQVMADAMNGLSEAERAELAEIDAQ